MLEPLYMRSPVVVQNAMLSAYGMLLYWRRVGSRRHRLAIRRIAEVERYDSEAITRLQEQLLKQILLHAARTVPYYRELLGPRIAEFERGRLLERLDSIEILEKDTVRINAPRFWSDSARGQYQVGTSGTTGSPLTVRCTREALLRNYAHFYRLRERLGVAPRDACATFAGRTVVEPGRTRPPYWRRNAVANTSLYSTYHIAPETIPDYLEELARQQPVLIDSYPSALGVIAAALRRRDDLRIRPRAIITSSETLLAHQRQDAEEAFQCRVTDQYGSAEMSAFLAQCEHGSYHAWPTYGICEVLVDGRRARAGEVGELVTTGFINDAMPMIRYGTGDAAVPGDGCPCGLRFPVIERIEGRTEDLIITPDGRMVGRLDPVFKGLPDDAFREVQIVQTAVDHVSIRYVAGTRYTPAALSAMQQELAKRLGPSIGLSATESARLPRSANGKLQAVIGLKRGRHLQPEGAHGPAGAPPHVSTGPSRD